MRTDATDIEPFGWSEGSAVSGPFQPPHLTRLIRQCLTWQLPRLANRPGDSVIALTGRRSSQLLDYEMSKELVEAFDCQFQKMEILDAARFGRGESGLVLFATVVAFGKLSEVFEDAGYLPWFLFVAFGQRPPGRRGPRIGVYPTTTPIDVYLDNLEYRVPHDFKQLEDGVDEFLTMASLKAA